MEWKWWIGKRIFVRLKDLKVYTGEVLEVNDVGNGLVFMLILDKFGQKVCFTTKEISRINEE